MIVLSGAALVLPDRILSPGTLFIDGDRIADIRSGDSASQHPHAQFAFRGHYIVPGFIDVHVHGVEGIDALDDLPGGDAVKSIAGRLPRFGVTGFCPTTVACAPEELRGVLKQVRDARAWPVPRGARVLPAHLESNFISAEYRGAQPLACLRSPGAALAGPAKIAHPVRDGDDRFIAGDILTEIERAAPDVGIVTLAPELDGGIDLIRWLTAHGIRAALGHSGASYDQAVAAIAAGATHATHLFNRMPPLHHRSPGLVGAVLQSDEVAAELIGDGYHVHPALVRTAVAAKRPSRIMAITDATAAAALPPGGRAQLGRQSIIAGEQTALLPDGTIAGSLTTMDRVFQFLGGSAGLSLVDAATVCATTPARQLGLTGYGVIAPDAIADLVVLDQNLAVVQTYVGGQLVYGRNNPARASV